MLATRSTIWRYPAACAVEVRSERTNSFHMELATLRVAKRSSGAELAGALDHRSIQRGLGLDARGRPTQLLAHALGHLVGRTQPLVARLEEERHAAPQHVLQ